MLNQRFEALSLSLRDLLCGNVSPSCASALMLAPQRYPAKLARYK